MEVKKKMTKKKNEYLVSKVCLSTMATDNRGTQGGWKEVFCGRLLMLRDAHDYAWLAHATAPQIPTPFLSSFCSSTSVFKAIARTDADLSLELGELRVVHDDI
jgi:hypothetical protein